MLLPIPVTAMVLSCVVLLFAAPAGAAQGGAENGQSQYHKLHPAFVVNLKGEGRRRFMQTEVQVKARSPATLEAVEYHQAAIRNELILLFSSQQTELLQTVEGKEKMRSEALKAINDVLRRETGEGNVAGVYFTSMVIQ